MLSVYTDGFDSHSLNTYKYAKGTEDWYPLIRQTNDKQAYKVGDHYLLEDDVILFEGNQMTIKEILEKEKPNE